ncbi:MAG: hypothetical protein K8W52_02345 [Deltaproteobacteria bacterium]|nr:hypothetical protein [Deltaproteobacteria bacterium]
MTRAREDGLALLLDLARILSATLVTIDELARYLGPAHADPPPRGPIELASHDPRVARAAIGVDLDGNPDGVTLVLAAAIALAMFEDALGAPLATIDDDIRVYALPSTGGLLGVIAIATIDDGAIAALELRRDLREG